MGDGRWTREHYETYARRTGRTVKTDGTIAGNYTAQEMYKSRRLSPILNPCGVIRECCDTEEHPETIPVILALDVTGSMGRSAVEIAKKLNQIMTDLYDKIKDVEFLIMGLGDVMYDVAPLQASQFESDIRIAEQLDQIYFEAGGGGNNFESYTAAWYFGARHTRLDCWKRGKKGIIVTIGDETINPYIPLAGHKVNFAEYMGAAIQGNLDSKELFREVQDKYELYHLVVDHDMWSAGRVRQNVKSFADYIGRDHVEIVTVETLTQKLVDIIVAHSQKTYPNGTVINGEAYYGNVETQGNANVVTWGCDEEASENMGNTVMGTEVEAKVEAKEPQAMMNGMTDDIADDGTSKNDIGFFAKLADIVGW